MKPERVTAHLSLYFMRNGLEYYSTAKGETHLLCVAQPNYILLEHHSYKSYYKIGRQHWAKILGTRDK